MYNFKEIKDSTIQEGIAKAESMFDVHKFNQYIQILKFKGCIPQTRFATKGIGCAYTTNIKRPNL